MSAEIMIFVGPEEVRLGSVMATGYDAGTAETIMSPAVSHSPRLRLS